ncbi:tetratricopeptide repeat protein [Emcibacter sp.]|uniref:tetratricopeptide repeat protein n=1 Tax=Emcibacter sp. TaxID=1979954 RepID=UPI003A8E7E70
MARCARAAVLPAFLIGAALPTYADCPVPDKLEDKIAKAGSLSVETHSLSNMECAATLALAAAEAAPENLEVQGLALGITAQAMDLMGSIKREDLMGTDTHLIGRINTLAGRALVVADNSLAKAPGSPDFKLLKALVVVIAAPWGEVEQSVESTRQAMALLEEVITAAPDTMGGLAQTVLGRIYFELPPILGGDVLKSISLLEDALERNPHNIQTLRYLAESYDQEMEEAKAVETLTAMMAIEPGPGEYQLVADELRLGRGLAGRLHAAGLVKKLEEKRQALLKAHPELMTRQSMAIGGHGGDHPLKEN